MDRRRPPSWRFRVVTLPVLPGVDADRAVLVAVVLPVLRVEGVRGDALEAAFPTVAHWLLATLPRSLTEQQVEVLRSFGASTRCGQRDQAIVQFPSTLGLRPGEVADLCLDDIDWRGGTLQIRAR